MPMAGTSATNQHIGSHRSDIEGDVIGVSAVVDPEDQAGAVMLSVWDEFHQAAAVAALDVDTALGVISDLTAAVVAIGAAREAWDREEAESSAARGVCEWSAAVASVDDLERLYESAAEDPELYGRES